MSKAKKIVPDDLILCINDFKKSLNGQTISIHGKDYATVALRLAVLRRNLGGKARSIQLLFLSIKILLFVKQRSMLDGTLIATGHAEEKKMLQE